MKLAMTSLLPLVAAFVRTRQTGPKSRALTSAATCLLLLVVASGCASKPAAHSKEYQAGYIAGEAEARSVFNRAMMMRATNSVPPRPK